MKTLILSIFIAIAFLISSCGQKSSEVSNSDRLEELLLRYPINGPGIGISVIQDSEIIYENYRGYSNLEYSIPITDSTKFLVASISKQFTAFSILLLESDGLLSIDDEISKYLPELADIDYQVSIKQLLNHTSGFRSSYDLNNLKGIGDRDFTSQDELVQLLFKQKDLNFTPGSRFQYCNAGYILLAEIVGRVSGMDFAEFAQERIFKPLEMNNSVFQDGPELLITNKAQSYRLNGEYENILFNRFVLGSTGLYTTAEDLCRWAANFDELEIGNGAIVQKMATKSILNNGTEIPYALGQEVKVYKGLDVIFHGGGDAGFRSYLLRVPEYKLSVAIAGNFEAFNPLDIAYDIVDVFLSDYIQESTEEKPIYTTKDLKKFEGDYQVFPGYYLSISAENDSLYFSEYDSDYKLLLPVARENEFIFPDRPHSKIVFYGDSLNWHFSDFYYPGKRVSLDPPSYNQIELLQYQGSFTSQELETSYEFRMEDGFLIAKHNLNPKAALRPIDEDAFISGFGPISRVEFTRNSEGIVNGCKISAQDTYDIVFSKDCN